MFPPSSFLINIHQQSSLFLFSCFILSSKIYENQYLIMYSSMITYAAIAIGVFAPVAWSASLQQVTDFGANPSNLLMYIYVPDKVATSPAVIVAVSIRSLFPSNICLISCGATWLFGFGSRLLPNDHIWNAGRHIGFHNNLPKRRTHIRALF